MGYYARALSGVVFRELARIAFLTRDLVPWTHGPIGLLLGDIGKVGRVLSKRAKEPLLRLVDTSKPSMIESRSHLLDLLLEFDALVDLCMQLHLV